MYLIFIFNHYMLFADTGVLIKIKELLCKKKIGLCRSGG